MNVSKSEAVTILLRAHCDIFLHAGLTCGHTLQCRYQGRDHISWGGGHNTVRRFQRGRNMSDHIPFEARTPTPNANRPNAIVTPPVD